MEILDQDQVWKDSVPQTLKDKIIREVDLNNDGVIDYQEFLTLVKGRHLGLGSKRRKAFRLLLKETVEFLVPYKYTYQVTFSLNHKKYQKMEPPEPVQLLAPATLHAPAQPLSDCHFCFQQFPANQ